MTALPESHNVLVIAYYFPPLGLSGVQRTLKFVKYFPAFGWNPTVLTVEPRGYFAKDESLLEELQNIDVEIVRTRSLDPLHFFRTSDVVQMPSARMHSLMSKLSQCFFLPDNKIGWKRKAVSAARKILKSKPFDAIFATAPPYTDFLIGAQLKKEFRIPLVIDYRDAWLDNPLHFYPTPLHKLIHAHKESSVLRAADAIITINRRIKELTLQRYESVAHGEIAIIPQGFDQSDFDEADASPTNGKIRFTHSGTFYYNRTPEYFLNGLQQFLERHPGARKQIEIIFIGAISKSYREMIARENLEDVVQCTGYIPHRECISMLKGSNVLWMTLGDDAGDDMMSTGKLFEYIGARKTILGLVPDGIAKRTILEYGNGFTVHPHDVEGIGNTIEKIFLMQKQNSKREVKEEFVQQYERKNLTAQVVKIFHSLIESDSVHPSHSSSIEQRTQPL